MLTGGGGRVGLGGGRVGLEGQVCSVANGSGIDPRSKMRGSWCWWQ
jgi:hypothetical protein